jgi:hypothetical protein
MKIGVLELLGSRFNKIKPGKYIDHFFVRKQYAGVMPQAISVWCRQTGHTTHYATYYGWGDPIDKLPNDLDIVFICTHTCLAPLAYGLARAYQREGTLTVVGGPHAKSYPHDCLRYFDLVVLECDKALIADIIRGQFDPHQIIVSPKIFDEIPTVEERLPEIRTANFWKGKPFAGSFIPILTSLGCPYTCNFCCDWNNQYRSLSTERLLTDLQYVSKTFPGVKLAIFDPNFGVRFNEVMTVFESIPPNQRNPYIIQSALTLLNPERIKRLRDTRCAAIMPGIESWSEYSHKTGVGNAVNQRKLEKVVDQFYTLQAYIPYLGVNFILGLDTDVGDEPFALTKEFLRRAPFVWPSVNIPMAFGSTPLHDTFLNEGRILEAMPFTFYEIPSLTVILKNYDPITYFQKMVDLYTLIASEEWLKKRLATSSHWVGQAVHYIRTLVARERLRLMQATLKRLQTDAHFLAFHTGQTEVLPDFYAEVYTRQLGKYIELVPLAESRPVLDTARLRPG